MNLTIIKHSVRLIILIAVQVVILNQIYFGGYITPYIYPVFILLLPFDVKGWVLLLVAFFTGLMVDMFSDSMGLHTSACLFMAFLRPWVIQLISTKTDYEPGTEPRIENNGLGWIITYTIVLIFVHHLALFLIEIFRFDDLLRLIFRVFLSTIVSVFIIMITHLLLGKPSRSRL